MHLPIPQIWRIWTNKMKEKDYQKDEIKGKKKIIMLSSEESLRRFILTHTHLSFVPRKSCFLDQVENSTCDIAYSAD